MSRKLSSELKNWFLALGFDDKNLSSDLIEEEFTRLSPPEMRDIWRNIMIHVLPTDRSRYIRKILLLYELKKLNTNSREKLTIRKNINSIKKFQTFKSQEKVAEQVNNCLKVVEDANVRINDKNQQIIDMDNKCRNVLAENSKRSNQQAMIELKIQIHERKTSELFELHSYLMNLNSFWNSKNVDDKHSSTDVLKDILKKINDFGRRKNNDKNMKIVDEQQILMNDVVKLTFDTPFSELHKIVIYMLKDTLSASLKLSDYVSTKHDNERSRHFNSKLIQLKKQSVELFIENDNMKKKVEKLREGVQNRRIQLLTMITEKCDQQSLKTFEMWLDSESLKHCMTTRLNYLIKKEESLKRTLPMSTVPDFANGSEQDKLFKVITECKNQLALMEFEMSNNLMYLSDESINSFIECQNHCKRRIELFIKTKNMEKSEDFVKELTDSLKKEISLLQKINGASATNRIELKPDLCREVIPDYIISEFVKKSSFHVYLTKAYSDICLKIGQEALNSGFLEEKRNEIREEEENFTSRIKKLVAEAKINLKNIEEHSNSCLRNYELWTKSSVNEIIPPQILVGDRSFTEWHKKYVVVIQCLRRQQIEMSKFD